MNKSERRSMIMWLKVIGISTAVSALLEGLMIARMMLG